jgi:hypothetical protein
LVAVKYPAHYTTGGVNVMLDHDHGTSASGYDYETELALIGQLDEADMDELDFAYYVVDDTFDGFIIDVARDHEPVMDGFERIADVATDAAYDELVAA